ncbi:MAG: DUF308 domain-containing protein [Bacteroidales bacterium]|jgi:uncharacterized membrane protein HdeD (DUF308 family)|nr:DUF308 domain-containing protein [Bacteroidales bacterium]
MKRHFENLTDKAGRAVQHWWLLMLAGIFSIALGIAVFVFPLQSYVVLSIIAGILMLFVGAAQLVIASTSGNYLAMRGYMLVGGVIDLILGLLLCVYPGVTMALLPVMLGIWMMYHAFMMIAFGGDLETFRVKGSGWTVFGGILLLIFSFIVLVNPFSAGIATVVVLAGVGLLVFGLLLCWAAKIFKDIDKNFEKEYPR